MRARRELTAERLRELLDDDTLTGTFRWRSRQASNGDWHHKIFNTRYAGKRAGCFDAHGYIQITGRPPQLQSPPPGVVLGSRRPPRL